ncbi:MAG: MiaB/RimO family radical SAM methylthiotransferase [Planctomycetota bacterium]
MPSLSLPQLPIAPASPQQPTDAAGSVCSTGASHVHPADHQQPDATPGGGGPSVYLETFGCQMNVLDSQLVTAQLRGLGYRFTDHWPSADVVLYNTCSVREQAENKVWSRVGIVGKHKRDHPHVVLGVIGCMAERDGEAMFKKHPQVDLLCGPGELNQLPQQIDTLVQTKKAHPDQVYLDADARQVALQGSNARRSATLAAAADQLEHVDLSRSFSPDLPENNVAAGRSAYVRITRGCNKLCTYCVVPHTRGQEVHRHPDHIVDECKKLADHGVLEITLLGQTVNHYHYDLNHAAEVGGVWQPQVGTVISPNAGNGGPSPVFNGNTTTFAKLLKRIHDEVPAIQRLRFVTSLPRDFGDDILRVIADSPRICPYLHLPVQSGSDRVLARMNRGYRAKHYFDLVDRVRHFLPEATLATDIIVGFPGETDDDYQKTRDLLEYSRYKNAFIFKYSPRPGTTAFDRLPDDVPDADKRARNNDLLALQSRISTEIHAEQVGKTLSVLVEGQSKQARKQADPAASASDITQLTGRTATDLIAHFQGHPSLVGTLTDLRITGSAALSLQGEAVTTQSRQSSPAVTANV